ncbi:MAG: methyl-accepting chemotaxis protein [Leptolyngbyaceae bacterium]|nr:methyl-accepting chemotaxis protein [Leptolyngbyaceae bacterium]
MKLGRVVTVGFGAIFITMIGIGVTSRFAMESIVKSNALLKEGYEVNVSLVSLESGLLSAETGMRGFFLTDNENYLDSYNQALPLVKQDLDGMSKQIINEQQKERLKQLEGLVQIRLDGIKDRIVDKRSGKKITTAMLDAGRQHAEAVKVAIDEMEEAQTKILEERSKEVEQAQQFANLVSIGGTIFALTIGGAILAFLYRKVIWPINQVTQQIASSSNEISATVEQQDRTASQQASSVNETTTTMDELGASSRQSAEQAEASAAGARQALTLAEGGTKAVRQTLTGMTTLKEKVGAIAEQILRLSEQTNQIGGISDLVADLANQTNMLALNAAVEAARAGDHGKGFAVVAGEIRKLADQSKKSAEKINSLVTDIQGAINSTVMVTDEGTKTVDEGMQLAQGTSEAFTGVADSINQVFLSSQQISLNVKQQAIAIQQVLDAMNALNLGAKENAAGIVQVRTSTHHLNAAAKQLQEVV